MEFDKMQIDENYNLIYTIETQEGKKMPNIKITDFIESAECVIDEKYIKII